MDRTIPSRAAKRAAATAAAVSAALFLLPASAAADFFGDVGWRETWTDNLFLVHDAESDWIGQPFVDFGFEPTAGVKPWIGALGYLYADHGELNAIAPHGGLDLRRGFGDGRHAIYGSLSYRGLFHDEESRAWDYHQATARLGLELRPAERFLLNPRLEANCRAYPNADGLSFAEGIGGLMLNASFQTGTTLRATGEVYYKRFLTDIETVADDETTGDETAVQSLTLAMREGNGGGSGGGSGSGSGSGGGGSSGGGSGSGAGLSSDAAGALSDVLNAQTLDAAQAWAGLRVAQAFGEWVGAYLEGSYRFNLLDPPRYVEGYAPVAEREIFDDHYAYEGPGGRGQVAVLTPIDLRTVLRASYEQRTFSERDALDLSGQPLAPRRDRVDQRTEFSLGLDYSLEFDAPFPRALAAGAAYDLVMNDSNDSFYDARENSVSLSASMEW